MKRTRIGIISAITVVIEALVLGALTLLRTRYILLQYGTNINGVIQLASQLTAYMLLFESGMTAAYQFNLYKPLLSEDDMKVSSLYKGMVKDFRIIAAKMVLTALSVAFVYSFILRNRGVTYFEAVSLLSIMGIRLVAPYVFTVPLRTLIIVKERKYITDIVETTKNTIALILEVLLIKFTSTPLPLVLSIHVLLCFLSRFVYKKLVRTYYKDSIKTDVKADRTPSKMTSDIIVHRVSGLINSNTDSVLLSLFKELGLNSVTIYTSFATIINYPVTLVTRIIDSMRATLALKIQSNNDEAYDYYREIMSFSKLCVLVVIPVYISQVNDFVTLWLGQEYTVSMINTVLFGLTAIHQMMMPTIYATRDAYGLYKESKHYSLGQAIGNLMISLALIKPLGILGVLLGTVISDWLIIEPLNIRLIFRRIFKRKFDLAFDYALLIIMLILSSSICVFINRFLTLSNGWGGFIVKSTVVTIVSSLISIILLYIFDYGFRKLVKRFLPSKILKFLR